MVSNENINAFIDFNFIPFNKWQCIKRLSGIWILSTILCFISKQFDLCVLIFGIINVLVTILFITLIAKYKQNKISRYLCDGIFYLYIAVILNVASYNVIALVTGSNCILLLFFLLLLVVCILIFTFATLSNIKSNKYSGINNAKKAFAFPLFCGAGGVLVAKIFLQGQSQQIALTIVAFVLLILSFVLSIPSINLLKAILCKKQID